MKQTKIQRLEAKYFVAKEAARQARLKAAKTYCDLMCMAVRANYKKAYGREPEYFEIARDVERFNVQYNDLVNMKAL